MMSPVKPHKYRVASLYRSWRDRWLDWPFAGVFLAVIVMLAYIGVLFLGSQHGTRLAAIRQFPSKVLCGQHGCGRGRAADGGSGRPLGALSGWSELFGLSSTTNDPMGDLDPLPLTPYDQLKFDFRYWISEAEKLVGPAVTPECDSGYGTGLMRRWRDARVDWCTAPSPDDVVGHEGGSSSSSSASSRAKGTFSSSSASNGGVSKWGGNTKGLRSGSRSLASSKTALEAAATAVAAAANRVVGGGGGGGWSGSGSALPPNQSSIALYPMEDKGVPTMFAASRNTVLDTSSFLGPSIGTTPGQWPAAPRGSYRAACHPSPALTPKDTAMELEPLRRWVRDALQPDAYEAAAAACTLPATNATESASSSTGSGSGGGGGPAPKPRTRGPVAHPVLLLSRQDSTNVFRTLEEAVTVFVALAALDDRDLAKQGLQVVIADGKPDGYFLDLWAALSRPYPLRILSHNPWPSGTCLTRAVHNAPSVSSLLSSMGTTKRISCRSTLVTAASLWLRHMLAPALLPAVHSAFNVPLQNQDVRHKTVVWISRRNLEGQSGDRYNSWQLQRMFRNEGDLVLQLQREVWRWNDEACLRSGLPAARGAGRRSGSLSKIRNSSSRRSRSRSLLQDLVDKAWPWAAGEEGEEGRQGSVAAAAAERRLASAAASLSYSMGSGGGGGGAGEDGGSSGGGGGGGGGGRCRALNVFYELRVVELSDLPFYPDQLQVLGQASILVGAHGAGLANMMFMPPGRGGVLEIQHNAAGNHQYHNLAALLGHRHTAVGSSGDEVDVKAAGSGLRKMMEAMAPL